jgi:putative tryptophan/tyrosine transport system substrate-binding protein
MCYALGVRQGQPRAEAFMKWMFVAAAIVSFASPSGAETAGERVYRLGHLAQSREAIGVTRSLTFPELAKLGFSEGRNLVVLDRFGEDAEMPRLVRELLDAKVDVIIAIGPSALTDAAKATKAIPIIGYGSDPTKIGLADSLARPGGNVTGVAILISELDAKRFDLLRQAVPSARRFAALLSPLSPQRAETEQELRRSATDAGVALQVLYAAGPTDYAARFVSMRDAKPEALVIAANSTFYRDGAQLAALALEAGLPTVCEWAEMAQMGCMLGYGPDRTELRRRVAHFVARILRGAAAAELPIERPTHFQFAINLTIARKLGVSIPAELVARADTLIE